MGSLSIIRPVVGNPDYIGDTQEIRWRTSLDAGERIQYQEFIMTELTTDHQPMEERAQHPFGPVEDDEYSVPWSPLHLGLTHRKDPWRLRVRAQIRPIEGEAYWVEDTEEPLWIGLTNVSEVAPAEDYVLWDPDGGQSPVITWRLGHEGRVDWPVPGGPLQARIRIYNLAGNRVRSLFKQTYHGTEFQPRAPGMYEDPWDGSGDPLPGAPPVPPGPQQPKGIYPFDIYAEHPGDAEAHWSTSRYLTISDVRACMAQYQGGQAEGRIEVSFLLTDTGGRVATRAVAEVYNQNLARVAGPVEAADIRMSPQRTSILVPLDLSVAGPRTVVVSGDDGHADHDKWHFALPALARGITDDWLSLRDAVKRAAVGQTFQHTLLTPEGRQAAGVSDPPLFPHTRSVGGDLTFLSDCPESLGAGTDNAILAADTSGLLPGVRYRFYVHHRNDSGEARRFGLMASNGGEADATVLVGPVSAASSISAAPYVAGQAAVIGYLNHYGPQDPEDLDERAPDAPTTVVVAPGQVIELWDFGAVQPADENNRSVISAVGELSREREGVAVYAVVGEPPPDAYWDDTHTLECATATHQRGTSEGRLVTRIGSAAIARPEEAPAHVQLVNSADQGWDAIDYTLWSEAVGGTNRGNWGRMHYVRFTLSNATGLPLNVAFVAHPPGPTFPVQTAVRDVGAARTLPVPQERFVNTPDRGTVLAKHTIGPGANLTKRFRYTSAGGSGAVMNIWVVPYCGAVGPT